MVTDTHSERIVITGMGVVSPIGIGNDAFWKNLTTGKSGIDRLTAFPTENLPCKLAAEVKGFNPKDFVYDPKHLKVMSRDIQLGVASATLAMRDADLERGAIPPERLGVVYGAGRISTTPQELHRAAVNCSDGNVFQTERWGRETMENIHPLWLLRQLPNMPACHVSIEHDARGPNNTITSRESSALLALSEGMNTILRGAADCMIVGACSSCIHPVDLAKLSLFENLSRHEDPDSACRPFDRDRDGAVVGEGAATFIIERYSHAVARGANIYAEVVGIGSGCDGRGYANGAGGTGLVRAIENAFRRADLDPRSVGHINAHGKSTLRDDRVESRAIHRAMGLQAEQVPVTALKSYFGHFDAGSGAVELAGSLLALKYGQLPMTLNYEYPDPSCQLNVVHDDPIKLRNRVALKVNRTSMGQSAAAILRAL